MMFIRVLRLLDETFLLEGIGVCDIGTLSIEIAEPRSELEQRGFIRRNQCAAAARQRFLDTARLYLSPALVEIRGSLIVVPGIERLQRHHVSKLPKFTLLAIPGTSVEE